MFIYFPDDRPFAFRGIWERWRHEEAAEPVDTFAIITPRPSTLMEPIHNRMPVIFSEQSYSTWLDREVEASEAEELLRLYPDGELEVVKVRGR